MESKSPHKTKDGGVLKSSTVAPPKPTVVNPIKQFGKVSLGFRGFKLVNSNIKLVKQVEVKSSTTGKLSTADALKQIRERIQQRKKIQDDVVVSEKTEHAQSDDASRTNTVLSSPVKNGPENIKNTSSKDDSKELSVDCPKKDSSETKSSKPSPTKNPKDGQSSSSSHEHSHRHDQRKPKEKPIRERSRSPHRSPQRDRQSNRERKTAPRRKSSHSRTEDHKQRDSHNHRYSPPRPRKHRSRSREDSRSYRHSHHNNHREKRKSWDSEARHTKSRSSQHRKQSPKRSFHSHSSDSKKTNSREARRSEVDGQGQQGEDTEIQTSSVDSELSTSEFEASASLKSEGESEYAARSECYSLDEEEDPPRSTADADTHLERDGLFSELSEFTAADGIGTENSESENGNNVYRRTKEKCMVDLMTTPSLNLVAKLYSDDEDQESEEEEAAPNLVPDKITTSPIVPTSLAEEENPTSSNSETGSQCTASENEEDASSTNQGLERETSRDTSSQQDVMPQIELVQPGPLATNLPSLNTLSTVEAPCSEHTLPYSTNAAAECPADEFTQDINLNMPLVQYPRISAVYPINHLVTNPCVPQGHIYPVYPAQPMSQDDEPQFSSCSSASTPLLDEPPTPPYSPLSTVQQDDEEDGRSWRGPNLIRTVVDPDYQSRKDEMASDDSKIPVLAQNLKSVFQSILQTDFSGADVQDTTTVPKLNGLIQVESDDVMPRSPEVEYGNDTPMEPDPVMPVCRESPNKTDVINPESHEQTPEMVDTPDDPSISEANEVKPLLLWPAAVLHSDTDQTTSTDTTQDINCLSPRPCPNMVNSSVSPCSNKLKLHATTKTPLPAKKSYIQQIDEENEIQNEAHTMVREIHQTVATLSDTFVNHPVDTTAQSKLEPVDSAVPDICTTSVDSNLLQDGVNTDVTLTDVVVSDVRNDAKQPDSAMPGLPSNLDLLRQDSSGSSPAEADDDTGPRRSARIKTKKEKTKSVRPRLNTSISEAGSNEPTPPVDSTVTEAKFALSVSSGEKAAGWEEVANKRIPKELSESDQFKAKINLAEGTDDAPDRFAVLEENLYLTAKKKSRARKEIRRMVCECALEEIPESGVCCGENCLNRLLMIECSSRCEFGDRCTNKRFQHKIYAPTEVFKTDVKGWGIRAAADIRAGELVMEYCGEVVDQREFMRRSLEYSQSKHAHFYFMALSQDEVIDATYKGNSSRFMNHSCDPNAETQKWTVNGRLRVGFFTLRDIPKGEELTFDYQFERYGKVAQICYCGTSKCRGYLGRAPDEDDKNSKLSKKWSFTDLTSLDVQEDGADLTEHSEREKKKAKKKLSLFEDDTMEKDISKLLGGLRSSKEVLTLSRLMVRCDTHSQRVICLQVLKETTSQTRLKTFLQFHGLSIIWSWMVDITAAEDDNAHLLKLDIIETLCKLPITNKNVIEDSKVLSVVQRWAKNGTDEKSPIDDEVEVVGEKKDETPNNSPTNENEQAPVVPVESGQTVEDVASATILSTGNDEDKPTADVAKEASSDEDSKGSNKKTNDAPGDETNLKILNAAASLLDSWKDLREIYRIPKRQKPVASPEQDSSSRDHSHSRTSSPLPKQGRNDDEYRGAWQGHSRRSGSQERSRDSSDHGWDGDRSWHRDRRNERRDSRLSPGSYGNDGKWESARRKRRFSTDSDDQSLNGKHVPWHCRPPQNSRFETKMSRQEHRKRFEKDMKKREQEKKRRVEGQQMDQSAPATALMSIPMMPPNNSQVIQDMQMGVQEMPMMSQDMLMMGQAMSASEPTFTPSGYSGNLIQINPSPQPQIIMQPFVDQGLNRQIGGVTQMMTMVQQAQNSFSMQMPVQQDFGMSGQVQMFGSQDPTMQMSYNIANQNLQGQQHLGTMATQIVANPMGIQQQPILQQPVVQPAQPQQQPSGNLTILGSQNGQAIVLLTAEQLKKLTQDQAPAAQQAQTMAPQANTSTVTIGEKVRKKEKSSRKVAAPATNDSPKSTSPAKLPPNWKIATDPEGRIYYYHGITRQTQWDPPTWDGKEEDMVGKKEAEMDLSSTPTYDEKRHKSSSKHKGERITEDGKKAKETFRLKMSQFVVQCLSSFRKTDCKVGRITSTEDFKHLARKLTHNIMLKEIKQVRVWEDLDFNANVRHKTKEYVKKYMSRVGPIYRIRDDNPMDPS